MAVAPNPLTYTTTGAKLLADHMLAGVTFRWVSPSAGAGDQCIVKDSSGNVVYAAVANGTDFIDSQRREPIPMLNGLTVDTLSSGTVYVDYK